MDNLILISLDLILLLILFSFIIYLRLPKILPSMNERLILCRKFVVEHEAPFNVGFLLLFALEQGILTFYLFLFRDSSVHLTLIVNLFTLIVIATASVQAILLQTMLKYERKRYDFVKRTSLVLKEIIPFLEKISKSDKKN